MENAKRDENNIPTLLAVSNVDDTTPVRLQANPTTHRLLVENLVASGITAPATTPTYLGQLFVDTMAQKLYFAAGITSSSDWIILN